MDETGLIQKYINGDMSEFWGIGREPNGSQRGGKIVIYKETGIREEQNYSTATMNVRDL